MFELYHKNCFELLEEKILVDLILIDPPYYISRKTNFSSGEWNKNEEERPRLCYLWAVELQELLVN